MAVLIFIYVRLSRFNKVTYLLYLFMSTSNNARLLTLTDFS